ncbi:MAG: KEOPS complex subunit Cgi121 [Promethearchaeota archaeon]
MRIEPIESDSDTYIVGISEIRNSKRLSQNDLLELSSSLSNENLIVQLLNGLLVADESHLLSAAQNAVNALNGNYMLTRTLDVEVIVYASAQRQIGKALDEFGIFDGLENVAAVVIGHGQNKVKQTLDKLITIVGEEFSTPFEATRERFNRIKEHFQIDDIEIATFTNSTDEIERQKALSKCVVSRVSLVAFDS